MNKYCILSVSPFFKKKIKKKNFFFFNKKKSINIKKIKKINPKIIFVPHWNWKIPKEIFENYLTIGFHATPLPYGRGGSPVQNMIIRGFGKTKICAIKLTNKIDAGPIYLKKSMTLSGNGDEIFLRMYRKTLEMIKFIIKKIPKEKKQLGKITYFTRRRPEESRLDLNQKNILKVYNFIRMLDINIIKNFPKSFVEIGEYKIKFYNSRVLKNKNKKIICNAEITKSSR
jgi:methionyl-tRNA formyltransferase